MQHYPILQQILDNNLLIITNLNLNLIFKLLLFFADIRQPIITYDLL